MARTSSRRAWWRSGVLACWGHCSATPAGRELRRPRPVADQRRLSEVQPRRRARGRSSGADDPDARRVGWPRDGRAVRDSAREASRDPRASRPSSRAIRRRRIASTDLAAAGDSDTKGGTRDSERYRSVKARSRPRDHVAVGAIIAEVPNRLAAEQSPYLLQHKDNPVDWYPWGEDASTWRAARTSRSSCRSATRRATGAT